MLKFQDALMQWWYGHNAVAFFPHDTLPRHDVLLPPRRRIAPYIPRLSIIPLLVIDILSYLGRSSPLCSYTALADWAQSLGTVFSLMLIAPSWGGMLNGLFTLHGCMDKVREEPVLKFIVVAVTVRNAGMATLEGLCFH